MPTRSFWIVRRSLQAFVIGAALVPLPSYGFAPSSDVGSNLSGSYYSAGQVIEDGNAAMSPAVDLGPLPDGADVVAYTLNSEGDKFFVLAHATALPGGVIATPRDVMTYRDGTYSVELGLAGLGLADGVAIDALSLLFASDSVGVSFDQPTELFGIYVDDADVLDLFALTLVLDADAAGIPDGLDLDALMEGANGDLIVSFDTGGSVGGVVFADEDLLRLEQPGYFWSLEVDQSAIDTGWERADLNAVHSVPEPSVSAGLLSGILALMGLARRKLILDVRHQPKRTSR